MAIETHGDETLETPAIDTRHVLLVGFSVLLLIGAAIGLLDAVYQWKVRVQSPPPPKTFPAPRVQAGQADELHRIQAEQLRRLGEYRWVDRTQGLVQIPIERAMQLIAQKGAQAYGPLAPASALSSPTAGAQRTVTPETQPGAAPTEGGSSPHSSSPGAREPRP